MSGIERGHLRLVLGEFGIGEGSGHGVDGVGVYGRDFFAVALNLGFFIFEMGLVGVVFGVEVGHGEGFGGGDSFCGWGGETSFGEEGDGALGSAGYQGGRHGCFLLKKREALLCVVFA